MSSYLNQVKNELNEMEVPLCIKYDVLKATLDITNKNSEEQIIALFGNPKNYIINYLKYDGNSHNVNYYKELEDKQNGQITTSSTAIQKDSRKKISSKTAKKDENPLIKIFKILYLIFITLPVKVIGILIIIFVLFSSIVLGFSALSTSDLVITLIVLNLSIFLIFNSTVILLKLFKNFIITNFLGGSTC